ncbi:murein transglycosylase A [Tropicimonas sp. S265A]|uniref:murein transglycosylase A n=1 Tax=Tropicimonas sp. S265A TaxID=3415134 RepID=UPI003C7C6197
MRGGLRKLAAAAAMTVFAHGAGANGAPSVTLMSFDDLDGWTLDQHDEALGAFLETCGDLKDPEWAPVCAIAQDTADARGFFEALFLPVLIEDGNEPLFTGYFEPEIRAARTRGGAYQYPVYATPPNLPRGQPWLTRAQIDQGALSGQGLEIAFAADPVDLFFLQVQGSGRLRLPDGDVMRIGFDAKNGHSYRSVGRELIRQGHLPENRVSAQAIRAWVRANGEAGRRMLHHNPSFVFFRLIDHVPPQKGPLGAMNRSITAHRSIAVDPDYNPLGAPVWVEKDGRTPIRRLMVAQDTGSAIKGAQRADVFYGTGAEAGEAAGRIRDGGRMIVLLPVEMALNAVRKSG